VRLCTYAYLFAGYMIKVSVILVTYNSENTLQRTLDSIIDQRGRGLFFNLELIVVDDCSVDRTQQILHENSISFLTTKSNSGGPNKGRNIALRQATGDYICFIDHDDVWDPEKTLIQLRATHYAPIITTGYREIFSNNSKVIHKIAKGKEQVLFREQETFLSMMRKSKKRQNTNYSTIMIRGDLRHVYFEEHFGMVDYDWILRLFENQRSVEIPKILMKRYVSGNNLSMQDDFRKNDFYYSLFTLENYGDKYPDEVKLARKRILGARGKYYYLINLFKNIRGFFLKVLALVNTGLLKYSQTS